MYELYLAHFGIPDQRWGIRRFQNKDGSLTPAGRERYSKGNGSPRHKSSNARKVAKQRAKNLEKARKAKAQKAEFEAGKKKALESGSATEILKYKGHLTYKEMSDAINRLDVERRLSEASAKEIAKGKLTFDKVVSKIDKARSAGETLLSAWNLVAKVHNSFTDEDSKWQEIGQPSERAKREKREKSQEESDKKNRALAKAFKSGKISDSDFTTLSKLKNNLSSKDIEDLIKKAEKKADKK